jgi:hypothetical protein
VNKRFETLNWGKWVSRDIDKRDHLDRLLSNYLSQYDKKELEYYCEFFGEERKVRDYWKALKSVLAILGYL